MLFNNDLSITSVHILVRSRSSNLLVHSPLTMTLHLNSVSIFISWKQDLDGKSNGQRAMWQLRPDECPEASDMAEAFRSSPFGWCVLKLFFSHVLVCLHKLHRYMATTKGQQSSFTFSAF